MPVLSYQVNSPGQGGVNPKIVYIFTNDPISVVTQTGYIDWLANPQGIYSGDVALVVTRETPSSTLGAGFYEFVRLGTGPHWDLVPQSGGGSGVDSVTGTLNQIAVAPNMGDVIVSIEPNPQLPGTGSVGIPKGTTAQQAGVIGSIRFNTDMSVFEGTPDGVTWVPFAGGGSGVDTITGTLNQISVSSPTGNVTISIDPDPILPGTASVTLPSGTTAQRGSIAGSVRFNSETNVIELTNDGSNWYTVLNTNNGVTSVTGTADRITVTGTNNAVVDIASTYVGQTSISTTGIITSGTWNADVVTVPFGGTGVSSFTPYTPVCGGMLSTDPLQSVASLGNSGDILTSNGPGNLPTFEPPSGSGAGIFSVRVPITAAQWNTIRTTPFLVIPAQGANTVIMPFSMTLELVIEGVAFLGSGEFGLQYGNTPIFSGARFMRMNSSRISEIDYKAILAYSPVSDNNSSFMTFARDSSLCINTAMYMSSTSNFTGGTGATIYVNVSYVLLTTT